MHTNLIYMRTKACCMNCLWIMILRYDIKILLDIRRNMSGGTGWDHAASPLAPFRQQVTESYVSFKRCESGSSELAHQWIQSVMPVRKCLKGRII